MQSIKLILSLIISISVMVADHKFNLFDDLRFGINFLATPIYSIINIPISITKLVTTSHTKSKNLENQKQLLSLKTIAQNYNSLLLENKKLTNILNASYKIQNIYPELARITKIKQSRLKKNIIIDKGVSSGLRSGDTVLASDGIVGRIINVNNHFSVVRLITDPLSNIPAMSLRNGERGIIHGMANNSKNLIINYVDTTSDVRLGDIFITSGLGGVFNNSYPVGLVSEIIQDSQNFIKIILTPIQKINQTTFVLVNKFTEEL